MRRALLVIALLAAPALQAGTVLRGGAFATIERPAVAANAEEWEAFLSLDGGKYYAFRITPHLDIARKQFIWLVPNADTTNARILIRAGNERRETLYEQPATFAIVRDARAVAPRTTVVPAEGEPARAGEPGVVGWTDGDRAGGAIVQRTAAPDRTRVAALRVPSGRTDVAIAHGGLFALSSWLLGIHDHVTPKSQELRAKSLEPRDLLLQTSRLNI
ncbi:MAG TPA: hypothetical protein VG323_04240 [Thermoanaerobaculia bacterium]|nr:hypothetical protein [Thermoanaerobaculia bacterium]